MGRFLINENRDADLRNFIGSSISGTTREVVSVRRFGARGGNTPGANRAAMQAAIDAAIADGLALSLERETYTVDDELLVDEAERLEILGNHAVVQQSAAQKATFHIRNSSDCVVSGLSLVGNGTETPWAGGNTSWNQVAGIHINGCSGVSVSGCRLSNHAGGGIRFSSGCERLSVTQNTIIGLTRDDIAAEDNGNDVAIGSTGQSIISDLVLLDTVISGNIIRGHAFGISPSRAVNCSVTSNSISNIPGQHGIYVQSNSEAVTIAGNSINNVAQVGIKVQSSQAADHRNIVIDGNSILNANQGVLVNHLASGQFFRGVVVSNNAVTRGSESYLGVNGLEDGIALDRCLDAVVTDNRVSGQGRYGIFGRRFSGIVADNKVRGIGHDGIFLQLADDTVVADNFVVDSVQSDLAATTGRQAPIEINRHPDALVNPVKAFVNNNTLDNPSGNGDAMIYSLRASSGVKAYVDGITNLTDKLWRLDDAPAYMRINVSRSADYFATASLNPTTPIYGEGRRRLYGTQDPAAASMTDYFRPGDICWNAAPAASGTIGWVCVSAGTPGTWKAFGDIEA